MGKVKLRTFLAVERIKFFLKVFGAWPSDAATSKCLSMLYSLYGIMAIVTWCVLCDLPLIMYVPHAANLQEAAENLCVNLTFLAFFGKYLNFKIFVRRIKKALDVADEFTLDNVQEMQIVGEKMKFYKTLCRYFYVAVNLCLSFGLISPLFEKEIRLPLATWYPFEWKSNSTIYAWLYMYQVLSVIVQANANTSVDLLTAYLMHVASIKLKVLGQRLEKLSTAQHNQQYDKEFVKCVACYQKTWSYVQELQKCFTQALLVQLTISGAVICSLTYQLTNTSPLENVLDYSYLMWFQLSMLFQIAVPCYFGNEIILKHERLTQSIFHCGWYLRSTQHKMCVIIFLEIVKIKLSVLVGNWFELNLDLLVSIIRFAYRMYSCLV